MAFNCGTSFLIWSGQIAACARVRSSAIHNSERARVFAEDIREGIIYDRNDMKVTAFQVDHGNTLAFGYRIDHGGKSVVYSGDMTLSENLVKFSKGADKWIDSWQVPMSPLDADFRFQYRMMALSGVFADR